MKIYTTVSPTLEWILRAYNIYVVIKTKCSMRETRDEGFFLRNVDTEDAKV